MKEGSFRQDLYFRLNVVRVVSPPLSERGEDMALVVNHFLQRFEKEYGRAFRVAQSAIDLLQRYDWPENVRELAA